MLHIGTHLGEGSHVQGFVAAHAMAHIIGPKSTDIIKVRW